MTLSQELTFHYVGLFKVIEQINPVVFRFLLPDDWKVHDVFYALQLKLAIDFEPGSSGVTTPALWPIVDDSSEFKVEDILDARFVRHGHQLVGKFLIDQHGYDLFEVTWETLSDLTN